jgi:hypothetical protein
VNSRDGILRTLFPKVHEYGFSGFVWVCLVSQICGGLGSNLYPYTLALRNSQAGPLAS